MIPRAYAWGVSCLLAAGLAACANIGDSFGTNEQNAQPIDRLLLGQAAKYPAEDLRPREAELHESMAARRKAAWAIVERTIATVQTEAMVPDPSAEGGQKKLTLPRFQTWYAREDVLPMFDRLFRGLSPDEQRARAVMPAAAIDAIFPWNATMAPTLASFTQERLDARKRELATDAGGHSLGKDPRVLMSPEYVAHVLGSYDKLLGCDPNDTSTFAPCLHGEFPTAAAVVKTRWMRSDITVPTYDTSAAGLGKILDRGTFGDGDGQANPGEEDAYTMRVDPSTTSRLVALHIATKELQDWMWITLWWSPDPDTDFGADRPQAITGAFSHYKMCVVSAYDEGDGNVGKAFPQTLADSLNVAAARGPATWCSNPYLEVEEHAATTNCIGCHQHGGTGETTATILADPAKFPDTSRKKLRDSFPVDYAYTTHGGLELASEMRTRVEAITPP